MGPLVAQLPGGRVVALNQAINEQAIPAGIQVLIWSKCGGVYVRRKLGRMLGYGIV